MASGWGLGAGDKLGDEVRVAQKSSVYVSACMRVGGRVARSYDSRRRFFIREG